MTDADKPLTYPEARALLGVVGDVDPAHYERRPLAYMKRAEAAQEKLRSIPRGGVMLTFSQKEMELLWHALGAGAGDDAIHNLGLSAAEKRVLRDACNRIKRAGRLAGPEF